MTGSLFLDSEELGENFYQASSLLIRIYSMNGVFAVLLKLPRIALSSLMSFSVEKKIKLLTTFKSRLVVIARKVLPYVD